MKKLLVAALMVLVASPAFAAIQNVKVSGSVTSYFVDRSDFDFKVAADAPSFQQNFFYTSTHVLIASDLSDNVSAQVGLANEVAWGDQNLENSTTGGGTVSNASDQQVDLELANVTLREFLYSPLTITIGRQSLTYGNDFIIGAGGGDSVGTMANVATDMSRTQNYDGIRAVLDYKPLTIDMVYVKTNSNCLSGGLGNTNAGTATCTGVGNDDQNLYGTVANYQLNDPFSTVVTGSFWARIDDSKNTDFKGAKAGTLFVPDLQVSTNPTKDLSLGLEGATQSGTYVNTAAENNGAGPNVNRNESRTDVWAMQAKANYNIPVLTKYKPALAETFSYYSGQNIKDTTNNSETKYHAWDPMFNDQDLGTRIWRALFTYSDLETSELSFQVNPLEDVTAQVVWTDLFAPAGLSTAGYASGLYQYSASLPDLNSPTLAVTKKTGLGNEVDGILTYNYTEDVTFGLNVGLFVPGDAFKSSNNAVAKEAIASVGVNF